MRNKHFLSNCLNSDGCPSEENRSGSAGYMNGDFNCDGQVNNSDKNDIWAPNGGLGTQVPN